MTATTVHSPEESLGFNGIYPQDHSITRPRVNSLASHVDSTANPVIASLSSTLPSAIPSSSSSTVTFALKPADTDRATYALLPASSAALTPSGAPSSASTGATVKSVASKATTKTPKLWARSACGISYEIKMSAKTETTVKAAWDEALLDLKNKGYDIEGCSIGLDYSNGLITIHDKYGTLVDEIVTDLPKADEMKAIANENNMIFGVYLKDSDKGQNSGSRLSHELTQQFKDTDIEEMIKDICHVTSKDVTARYKGEYLKKQALIIKGLKDEFRKNATDGTKEIKKRIEANENAIAAKRKAINDEQDKIDAKLTADKAADVAAEKANKKKYEQEIDSLKKDPQYLADQNELNLLNSKIQELDNLDIFAINWILLTMVSFEEGANYFDSRARIPFNLDLESHREAASKLIYDQLVSTKLPRSTQKISFFGLYTNQNDITDEHREYAAVAATMLSQAIAESRGEVVRCAQKRGVGVPALSLESRFLEKILEVSKINPAMQKKAIEDSAKVIFDDVSKGTSPIAPKPTIASSSSSSSTTLSSSSTSSKKSSTAAPLSSSLSSFSSYSTSAAMPASMSAIYSSSLPKAPETTDSNSSLSSSSAS